MEHDMVPTLEHIVIIKIAIQISNYSELKREILFATCSEYHINNTENEEDSKEQWQETVQKKATVIMRNLALPEFLRRKVIGFVIPIGMRMLNWAAYHEGSLGFTRENSINILNSSLFTQRGIMDNKKAAERLINDESLNNKQKYNVACLYCFTDLISHFYRKTTRKDKEKFYNLHRWIREPDLVMFWSYYLIDKVDELKGDRSVHLYRLQKAIESGSKAAVEYCFEISNFTREKDVVDAALEAVRMKIKNIIYDVSSVFHKIEQNAKSDWVPSDFYMDILCFLLSKMTVNTQIEFLKEDIRGNKYVKECFFVRHYGVLEFFLNWPYQDYFMKTVAIMWDILPERKYPVLLLKICDKIEPQKFKDIKVSNFPYARYSILHKSHPFGDERSYDYRGILESFWFQSPEHFKRYVFITHEDPFTTRGERQFDFGVALFIYLLTLKHFTDEDRKIIRLILASATDEEKENITSSKDWLDICVELMEEEKQEILDRIDEIYFPSKEKCDEFKRMLEKAHERKKMISRFQVGHLRSGVSYLKKT